MRSLLAVPHVGLNETGFTSQFPEFFQAAGQGLVNYKLLLAQFVVWFCNL